MLGAELITQTQHAAGDQVRREVETTCSNCRNGNRLQLAVVCLPENVLDEMTQNLDNNVTFKE